eukprot:3799868-Amphidinium_carterae.1
MSSSYGNAYDYKDEEALNCFLCTEYPHSMDVTDTPHLSHVVGDRRSEEEPTTLYNTICNKNMDMASGTRPRSLNCSVHPETARSRSRPLDLDLDLDPLI